MLENKKKTFGTVYKTVDKRSDETRQKIEGDSLCLVK